MANNVDMSAFPSIESLTDELVGNHLWRQTETFNLIPSENTPSLQVRLASIMDPSGRYAEHSEIDPLGDVGFYEATELAIRFEKLNQAVLRPYLSASEVEVRPISGNISNEAFYSALRNFHNRFNQGQPRNLGWVVNHHLGRGGHLSAQKIGALGPYIMIDDSPSGTGRSMIEEFPVRGDDPYQIDLEATKELLEQHRNQIQLIVLGKSMMLYKEPVREIAEMVKDFDPKPLIMYDASHVMGLIGPFFQSPLEEGADVITGSTHKTYFGTQRGLIASNMGRCTDMYPLWEKIVKQVFPGKESNHHLGTLIGLLYASYEMGMNRDEYQLQVISNAKAFARASKDVGLNVEGDPSIGYTETHQNILNVGRGKGPEISRRLKLNYITTNPQTLPNDSGSPNASGIREGVQEMTRFGMKEANFGHLAELKADVILRDKDRSKEVSDYRKKFLQMEYGLSPDQAKYVITSLNRALFNGH